MCLSKDGFNDNEVKIKGCFAWGQKKISEYIKNGNHFVVKKSLSTIYYFLNNEDQYIAPSDTISDEECGVKRNTDAKEEMRTMGLDFDYSKPISLIKYLINMLPVDNVEDQFLVLDFFAGSSTTANAVMKLNSEDGQKRNFIMVQLPEPCDENSDAFKSGYKTISEISKERIRRAGAKIKADSAITAPHLDIGFRVLKIDSSNMMDVYYTPDDLAQHQLSGMIDNIKKDRTSDDLLFQVLLDLGIDLASPITQETMADKTVYFVDGNTLAACFDTGINEELVQLLAKRQPQRAVFRDAGFANDSEKINVEQIFKVLSPHTQIKTI